MAAAGCAQWIGVDKHGPRCPCVARTDRHGLCVWCAAIVRLNEFIIERLLVQKGGEAMGNGKRRLLVAVAVHIHMEIGKIIKVVRPFFVPRKRPVLGRTARAASQSSVCAHGTQGVDSRNARTAICKGF